MQLEKHIYQQGKQHILKSSEYTYYIPEECSIFSNYFFSELKLTTRWSWLFDYIIIFILESRKDMTLYSYSNRYKHIINNEK